VLSNHGLDAEGITAALTAAVDRVRADVIFTDLPAGSCTTAARRLAKQRGTLTVVTGANLPMLLDFLLKAREGAEGAALAAGKGRDGVMVFAAEGANGG
jgi:PTS system N-acetylgalactosamine-specific IIA component